MKTLTVIIEHAGDNLSAYIKGVPIVVVGDNLDEVKKNMHEAIGFYLESETNPVSKLQGVYELVFKFDAESLLNYYTRIFSYVSLQYLTGINQKQLCHYASGLNKPRERQKRRIETALHKLGYELLAVRL